MREWIGGPSRVFRCIVALDIMMNPALPCTVSNLAKFLHGVHFELVRPRDDLRRRDRALHVAAVGRVDARAREMPRERFDLRAALSRKLDIARTGEAIFGAGGGGAMTNQEQSSDRHRRKYIVR